MTVSIAGVPETPLAPGDMVGTGMGYQLPPLSVASSDGSSVTISVDAGKITKRTGFADWTSQVTLNSGEAVNFWAPAKGGTVVVTAKSGQVTTTAHIQVKASRTLGRLNPSGILSPGFNTGGNPTMIWVPAVRLQDGRILQYNENVLSLYNPEADYGMGAHTTKTLPTTFVDYCPTATLLDNGKVLICGGWLFPFNSEKPSAVAQLFNPATESFEPVPNLKYDRVYHTATKLPDGRVLIAGGLSTGNGFSSANSTATAELFDPATNSFTLTGSMGVRRDGHSATLLGNGQVLIAGGATHYTTTTSMSLDTTEKFQTTVGSFVAGPVLGSPRYLNAAIRRADGRVLITGGSVYVQSTGSNVAKSSTDLYDPVTDSVATGPTMGVPRWGHSLASDGTTLWVMGGVFSGFTNSIEELPADGSAFSSATVFNNPTWIYGASAIFLPPTASFAKGRVLLFCNDTWLAENAVREYLP